MEDKERIDGSVWKSIPGRGKASAKAMRQEGAWHVQEKEAGLLPRHLSTWEPSRFVFVQKRKETGLRKCHIARLHGQPPRAAAPSSSQACPPSLRCDKGCFWASSALILGCGDCCSSARISPNLLFFKVFFQFPQDSVLITSTFLFSSSAGHPGSLPSPQMSACPQGHPCRMCLQTELRGGQRECVCLLRGPGGRA